MFFRHKIEDYGILGKVHATRMRMSSSICFFMDTPSSCAYFFKMTEKLLIH